MMFVLLFFSFLFIPAVHAEETDQPVLIQAPDFPSLKHTQSGRVDKVVDGLTVLLKDNTILRLSSLSAPSVQDEYAFQTLQSLLPEGTEIRIYQTLTAKKGRENRMGHKLGHIVTKKDNIWINGTWLARGAGWVECDAHNIAMAQEMIQIEHKAREAENGVWNSLSVLTPEQTPEHIGRFAIVEGTAVKAASVRNNIYLNFGQNWRDDFTILIKPALRKKLSRAGIDALSLGRDRVRVRGWVRDYNGPLIELDVVEHLEILNNDLPQ